MAGQSPSCIELLPLCTNPKVVTREGLTGATAYMNLIGVGIWFASGAQLSFPGSEITQDKSLTYQGTVKPNTFSKGFSCNVPGTCPA